MKLLIMVFLVKVGFLGSALCSKRPELEKLDQPVVFFRAIQGAKYPMMFKFIPAADQLNIVFFGVEKSGYVRHVKRPSDLMTLVPIRYGLTFADSKTKIDKKYEGFRDSPLGKGFENLFKMVGLLPTTGYKGTALVDEYNAGIPMKLVLSSVDQFKALKVYLRRNLAFPDVTSKKPLLLLEILDTTKSLDEDDKTFLNAYFDVCDPLDPAVKKFFENAQKSITKLHAKIEDAKHIGESAGEMIFRAFEENEKCKTLFDAKKLASYLVTAGLAVYVWNKASTRLEVVEEMIDQAFPNIDNKVIMAGCASAATIAALIIAYNVWLDRVLDSEVNELPAELA